MFERETSTPVLVAGATGAPAVGVTRGSVARNIDVPTKLDEAAPS